MVNNISVVNAGAKKRAFNWTARCKSGFTFGPKRKVCTRFTARGALLCSDCASAVVISEEKVSFLASLKAFFAQPVFGGSN